MSREYNASYEGEYLDYVAFPLGGIGTGMVCLQGHGALGSFVLHYEKPNIYNDPMVFSAICVKGEKTVARVLEGPIPKWKIYGNPASGNGLGGTTYGLPRFDKAVFKHIRPVEQRDGRGHHQLACPLDPETRQRSLSRL